jgi:hypothetical protein
MLLVVVYYKNAVRWLGGWHEKNRFLLRFIGRER